MEKGRPQRLASARAAPKAVAKLAFVRVEETADNDAVLAAFDAHGRNSDIGLARHLEAGPERIEVMRRHLARGRIFANLQGSARDRDFFARPCRMIVPAEGKVDQKHVEPEKPKIGQAPMDQNKMPTNIQQPVSADIRL